MFNYLNRLHCHKSLQYITTHIVKVLHGFPGVGYEKSDEFILGDVLP